MVRTEQSRNQSLDAIVSYGLGERFRVGGQLAQGSVDRNLDLAGLTGFVQCQVQGPSRVGVLRRAVGVVVVLLHLLVEDAIVGEIFLFIGGWKKEKKNDALDLYRRCEKFEINADRRV